MIRNKKNQYFLRNNLHFTFFFKLFNGAVNILDELEWTGKDSEGSGRGTLLWEYFGTCLDRQRKITKYLTLAVAPPDIRPGHFQNTKRAVSTWVNLVIVLHSKSYFIWASSKISRREVWVCFPIDRLRTSGKLTFYWTHLLSVVNFFMLEIWFSSKQQNTDKLRHEQLGTQKFYIYTIYNRNFEDIFRNYLLRTY